MTNNRIGIAALTVAQVIELTGFSRPKVYAEINAGRLVARKCVGRTIILMRDFEAFLDALPLAGQQPAAA